MTRNTAREIAAHLSYELSFTDKTVEELLQERLTSEAFAELAEEDSLYTEAFLHKDTPWNSATGGSTCCG